MMKLLRMGGTVWALLLISAGVALAENTGMEHKAKGAPFDIEQWMQRKEPASRVPIVISPDGKWLAVSMKGLVTEGRINSASLPREGGVFETASEELAGSEVWIVERESGKVTRPFQQFAGSYGPVWSPVGCKLALTLQDAPTRYPRVALWSPGNVLPQVFTNAPCPPGIGFTAPTWTPDGQRMVFTLRDVAPPKAPRLVRTVVPDTDENDAAQATAQTLAVLDVATGGVRPLKGLDYNGVWGFRLSPDGQRVAFLHQVEALQPGVVANWVRLAIVTLADGSIQNIGTAQPDAWGLGLSWSPDGRHIAWRAVSHGAPEKLLLATVGTDSALREATLPKDAAAGYLLSVSDGPPAPPLWTADSAGFWITGKDSLLHFAADGAPLGEVSLPTGEPRGGADWLDNAIPSFAPIRTQAVPPSGDLYLLRKSGIECVNLETKSTRTVAASAGLSHKWAERAVDWNHALFFTLHRTGNRGLELLQTALRDGKTARLALLQPGLGQIDYGETRSLSWKLADGTACAGTLLLPMGWKPGDQPPVVMQVYGNDRGKGKLSADALNEASYVMNPHLLSLHGYAFFKPDLPQTDAEPSASLVRSGEAAADALRASGLVDAGRIGIMGQSYGGYTVLCLLTGSQRFKAGIAANGIYDLPRYATDGLFPFVEGGQFRMRASLWEKPQRYLDNSPLFALDKLQTPLLVLQGGGDNLTKNQGQPLLNSLQRLGKPAEFLLGTDMPHAPTYWSIETQRELIPRLLAFWDKHLKAKP